MVVPDPPARRGPRPPSCPAPSRPSQAPHETRARPVPGAVASPRPRPPPRRGGPEPASALPALRPPRLPVVSPAPPRASGSRDFHRLCGFSYRLYKSKTSLKMESGAATGSSPAGGGGEDRPRSAGTAQSGARLPPVGGGSARGPPGPARRLRLRASLRRRLSPQTPSARLRRTCERASPSSPQTRRGRRPGLRFPRGALFSST